MIDDYINKDSEVIKESKGSIYTGLSILLILCFLMSIIIVLTVSMELNSMNVDSIAKNTFKNEIEDYKKNIPNLAHLSTEKLSEKIILNLVPCENSSNEIKKILQEMLDEKNNEYQQNNNITINSNVITVQNTEDPFCLEVKTLIKGSKGDLEFNEIVTSKFSIQGLKDPIPFLKCGNHPTFTNDSSRIYYQESLKNYFNDKEFISSSSYHDAKSPYIIKKCSIDPYIHHGDGLNIKNCIENGYYHESADGSCYLCRLEGKGFCYHYGFETFIIPHNLTLNEITKSICSSDHVIFGENNYSGDQIVFHSYGEINEILFLDDGHRSKYGLS